MPLVLLLLVLWPVGEIYVAVKVAQEIGVLPMVLALIAAWPLGAWSVRSQGRVVWRRLSNAVLLGRLPGREVVDGALILIGGTLLIIPGFITDVIGLALLLAPVRYVLRRAFARNLRSRLVVRAVTMTRRGTSSRSPAYDVESTAHDVEHPQLP